MIKRHYSISYTMAALLFCCHNIHCHRSWFPAFIIWIHKDAEAFKPARYNRLAHISHPRTLHRCSYLHHSLSVLLTPYPPCPDTLPRWKLFCHIQAVKLFAHLAHCFIVNRLSFPPAIPCFVFYYQVITVQAVV